MAKQLKATETVHGNCPKCGSELRKFGQTYRCMTPGCGYVRFPWQANPQLAGFKLGRIARRSTIHAVQMVDFAGQPDPPVSTHFWKGKSKFTPGTWGNNRLGDCTIAKQVNMFRRFERIERGKTVVVADGEVVRVYERMETDLYGGGDKGAFETDALDRSRREETCLHDSQGHPLLIDAYVAVNPGDQKRVKQALALAAGHGVAICIALPLAFQVQVGNGDFDIPAGQALIGDWEPGSWGGHSMWSFEYDQKGPWLEHTWGIPPQRITWAAAAAYIDECHVVIDSADAWRKRLPKKELDVGGIVDAVNAVSSKKIELQ